MKLFISADIEGAAGVTTWEETRYGGKGYEQACRQMTLEVSAACEAAIELGWTVVIKDGHEDACNLDLGELPRGTEVIRGWRCSPAAMMGGLDESFDAAAYIGYHAPEGTADSPLAHTIEHDIFQFIRINGVLASEFSMNALWAAAFGVPSVFLSGDEGICHHAEAVCPGIVTAATKRCVGNSTWNLHPLDAAERIKTGMDRVLRQRAPLIPLEQSYRMELCFKEHHRARTASWYPGAERIDSNTVAYTASDPRELMLAKMFMTNC